VPLLAGFGIATPEQAAAAAALADGIVVGTRAIEVADAEGPAGLERFVASLRDAIEAVPPPAR
jgi:tryptophan synthase alpha chain